AMWTLAGLGELKPEVVERNFEDDDWFVRLTALRLAGEATGVPDLFPQQFSSAAELLKNSETELVATYASNILESGYPNRMASVFKDKAPDWVKTEKPLHESYERGLAVYSQYCAACHQPHGKGLENLAPTLVKSDWVLEDPNVLIGVAMNGLTGPIKVNGKPVTGVPPLMPPHNFLSDKQMADALTYVRSAWGNRAEAIKPEVVKAFREEHKDRVLPWTEAELRK
ncbi:MAG: cytochrome c, partial [Verrucomicrobiota bacterium]